MEQPVTGSCYRCGRGGHFKADCPDAPRSSSFNFSANQEWCRACGQSGHTRDQQELINERGMLKVRAALAGDTAELDRLAELPASCTQSDAEWVASTYAVA